MFMRRAGKSLARFPGAHNSAVCLEAAPGWAGSSGKSRPCPPGRRTAQPAGIRDNGRRCPVGRGGSPAASRNARRQGPIRPDSAEVWCDDAPSAGQERANPREEWQGRSRTQEGRGQRAWSALAAAGGFGSRPVRKLSSTAYRSRLAVIQARQGPERSFVAAKHRPGTPLQGLKRSVTEKVTVASPTPSGGRG